MIVVSSFLIIPRFDSCCFLSPSRLPHKLFSLSLFLFLLYNPLLFLFYRNSYPTPYRWRCCKSPSPLRSFKKKKSFLKHLLFIVWLTKKKWQVEEDTGRFVFPPIFHHLRGNCDKTKSKKKSQTSFLICVIDCVVPHRLTNFKFPLTIPLSKKYY